MVSAEPPFSIYFVKVLAVKFSIHQLLMWSMVLNSLAIHVQQTSISIVNHFFSLSKMILVYVLQTIYRQINLLVIYRDETCKLIVVQSGRMTYKILWIIFGLEIILGSFELKKFVTLIICTMYPRL